MASNNGQSSTVDAVAPYVELNKPDAILRNKAAREAGEVKYDDDGHKGMYILYLHPGQLQLIETAYIQLRIEEIAAFLAPALLVKPFPSFNKAVGMVKTELQGKLSRQFVGRTAGWNQAKARDELAKRLVPWLSHHGKLLISSEFEDID
jgi:hypothetical protein